MRLYVDYNERAELTLSENDLYDGVPVEVDDDRLNWYRGIMSDYRVLQAWLEEQRRTHGV